MDYIQAREYIDNAYKKGSIYGLDSIRALVKALGNPQESLKIIHIAGTNGKGSVGAFISAVLVEAGYRVGRYVSPTVYCYAERFQINGVNISDNAFADIMSRVADGEAGTAFETTGFELETGAALLYFKEEKCDFAVVECGLGGRADATNVIDNNLLTVLTSISLDHMAILGDSIEEIAMEKCGIIKEKARVVSSEQQPSARGVIEEYCNKTGSTVSFVDNRSILNKQVKGYSQYFDYNGYKNVEIGMLGVYQYENAALALMAVDTLRELGFNISPQAVYKGMKRARWGGRFDIVSRDPIFVLDGAHNPNGAARLRESLELYFKDKRLQFIMGIFSDKDYEGIVQNTADLAERIYTITPPSPRGLDAKALAKTVEKYNANVEASDIYRAADSCMRQKDRITVAFGSLSFMGMLTEYISQLKGNKEQ